MVWYNLKFLHSTFMACQLSPEIASSSLSSVTMHHQDKNEIMNQLPTMSKNLSPMGTRHLISSQPASVKISFAVMKHHGQKHLGEERVNFTLHFLIRVQHQRKSGQEPRSRNWSRNHKECRLLACWCWLDLRVLSYTCPEVAPHPICWVSYINHLSRKCTIDLSTEKNLWTRALSWDCL